MSGRPPNAWRGETGVVVRGVERRLRPTFAALVAAEEELGPLVALVERAAAGQLRLSEQAALFWHCLAEPAELTREDIGGAIAEMGLARCAAPTAAILRQILQGGG